MAQRLLPLVICLLLVVGAPLLDAASGHDLWTYYVIPGVADVAGLEGTHWRTDLSIVNPYDWRSIRVYMVFLETDENNSSAREFSFSVRAGEALALENVVASVFGRHETTGAIEIYTKDDAYFIVSARVYTGTTETFGQTEMGQEYFGHAGDLTYISGVKQTSRYRSNIGAVNVSNRSISLEAKVYDVSGNLRGTKVFNILPYSHVQESLQKITGAFGDGYVIWRCRTAGTGIYWTTYVSVVDNNTGDAVFIDDRRNDQYVQFEPYYDLTGWWEGSTAGPSGDGTTWVYISQDGSEVRGWDVDLTNWPGQEDFYFHGYMDGNELHLVEGEVLVPYCWGDEVYDGHATVTSDSISGTLKVRGDCFNGTQTFALTPSTKKSAMPPPPAASRVRLPNKSRSVD